MERIVRRQSQGSIPEPSWMQQGTEDIPGPDWSVGQVAGVVFGLICITGIIFGLAAFVL